MSVFGIIPPFAILIERLENLSVEKRWSKVMEQFDVSRERIAAALHHVAQSINFSLLDRPFEASDPSFS